MKLLLLILSFNFLTIQESEKLEPIVINNVSIEDEKIAAFKILKNKCNVCHISQNKNRVFTLENMDQNAKRIYNQVFKWQRMPKGNDIKLSSEEYDQLRNWISTLN